MSFKYRFILSFVLLEIVFIILIVSINFYTIKNTSDKLINERVESNITFLEELIKVPLSIFDLASLDNLIYNSIKYVNSVIIIDKQDRILSSVYQYQYEEMENLISNKTSRNISINQENFKIIYKKIYQDDTYLGSMFIIFDLTPINQYIQTNKQNTFIIILLEIIASSFLAFLLGIKLTKSLTNLSNIAIKIGKEEETKIPYRKSNSELGTLANAMYHMQTNLKMRTKLIKDTNILLEKQKNDLTKANKIKDDFLANMSHELKTPLNSINVISSIMQKNSDNNLNDKQLKNLEVINQCGNDLLYLVNDVLDISKLEAKEIELDLDYINLDTFFKDIYKSFSPLMKEKNLEFKIDSNFTFDKFYTDKNRLKQIIKNLLSNALKFTSEGTINLKVHTNANELIIIIKDSGIGIPKDKQLHIFDRFKQVDNTTTRKFGGTGLGLAITKELVELLNGEIFLDSKINKGSTFVIQLPLDINTKDEKRKKEKKQQFEQAQENKRDKKTILILNDDPISLFKIIVELSKDFEVIQSNNLEEFIKINSSKKISKAIIKIDDKDNSFFETLKKTKLSNYIAIHKEKLQFQIPDFISSNFKLEKIEKEINTFKETM